MLVTWERQSFSSKDTALGIFFLLFQLVAKGRDVSELFPAVVKNVAAKNLEVKICYLFLTSLSLAR